MRDAVHSSDHQVSRTEGKDEEDFFNKRCECKYVFVFLFLRQLTVQYMPVCLCPSLEVQASYCRATALSP